MSYDMNSVRLFSKHVLKKVTFKTNGPVLQSFLPGAHLLLRTNHERKALEVQELDKELKIKIPEKLDPQLYQKPILQSFNLAAFANTSPILQNFVKLGVEIYKFDKDPELCEFILRLDFDKDVRPFLVFLCENGVPPTSLGAFLSKNPYILKSDINDLIVRINYLHSKNFSEEMISTILEKNPHWLLIQVKDLDKKLGFFQSTFKLKGHEVRELVTKCPRLVTVKHDFILSGIFAIKEEMGLELKDMKKMVLAEPKLLIKNRHDVINAFQYLHRQMGIPIHLILKQPEVLNCRVHILSVRHKYLTILGRAQYDPNFSGYVPLLNLVQYDDEKFAKEIAFTSLDSYEEYLKSL